MYKADLDLPTADGSTAAFIAAENGHAEVLRALGKLGATLGMPNDKGATAAFSQCSHLSRQLCLFPNPMTCDNPSLPIHSISPFLFSAPPAHSRGAEGTHARDSYPGAPGAAHSCHAQLLRHDPLFRGSRVWARGDPTPTGGGFDNE